MGLGWANSFFISKTNVLNFEEKFLSQPNPYKSILSILKMYSIQIIKCKDIVDKRKKKHERNKNKSTIFIIYNNFLIK